MNDRLLETFVQLVSFDQTVRSLEIEHESLTKNLALIHDQKARIALDIEDGNKKIHELKKAVDSSELIMKILDQQESDKKNKLENVSGPKEYSFLKSDIQKLNKEQEIAELELIEAWGVLDIAQKKLEILTRLSADKLVALDREVDAVETKLKAINIALEDHAQQRLVFVAQVPAEILGDYEHMRGLVTNPVVPALQASCSGCFYPIPISDMLLLRKGKLLPCKSCYRILYFDESVS